MVLPIFIIVLLVIVFAKPIYINYKDWRQEQEKNNIINKEANKIQTQIDELNMDISNLQNPFQKQVEIRKRDSEYTKNDEKLIKIYDDEDEVTDTNKPFNREDAQYFEAR